ncbi:hypothetical protein PMI30_02756 [Pseudomonas sp. GM50]|uniref:hypothetical protein n=1 Tax=Pseudomonas sp. GM50 TaxID=1144332 RepID=UPI00027078BF|nr:hypothetical protein [Pseudomonas sp. GM50]EJM66546.1 hypothetical protein PMI30_02756 [Pseudomonas sp. GM50]
MSTSTVPTKNESSAIKPANGTGTFTAKFERPPGAPTLPDFTGKELSAAPNAPPLLTTQIQAFSADYNNYMIFNFPTALDNGQHPITPTNSDTYIIFLNYRYLINSEKPNTLNITVDNGAFKEKGEYKGDFKFISSDQQGREVTITGNFDFTTTPTKQ